MHDDLDYEARIAVQDPELIRANLAAGLFTLHGVDLSPLEETIELGRALAGYRAEITRRAFETSHQRLRRRRRQAGQLARPSGRWTFPRKLGACHG
jgi:hypothetical protein